jgi:HlyD family secretion protein
MKKLIITLIVLGLIAGSVGAYYKYRGAGETVKISTLAVGRGDIIESVGATGTLQAVTTVQVGSQVSGNIKAMYADFNSIVRKGQIIAELDPSLLQTQIEQANANLVKSQAELDRLRVSLDDAKTKLKRSESLAQRQLLAPQDLEAAQVAVRSAEAQIKSQEASVTQAKASLSQNQVNLQHTVIEAPIDGIVIQRSVDVGQTVAASMNAPTLFIIAADLTKMQVNANVDESDVGRIRPGQVVKFRVDAYPLEEFAGTVSQVRLNPTTTQNVVTYATVIDVPNTQLKLKPGMTATVTIEIAKRTDAIRVPNAALRFRPTTDTFAALNQAVPPDFQRGLGSGRMGGATGGMPTAAPSQSRAGAAGPATAGPATTPTGGPAGSRVSPAPAATGPTQQQGRQTETTPGTGQGREGRGGFGGQQPGGGAPGMGPGGAGGFGAQGGDPEERRRRFQERMASMTPEERAQFEARMRERGIDPNNMGRGGAGGPGMGQREGAGRGQSPTASAAGQRGPVSSGLPGQGRPSGTSAAGAANPASAQTIDQLFGPLPVTETSGRVWVDAGGQLKSVRLRLGITDSTYTELLSGELKVGQEVVTGVVTPAQAASAATRSPLMPGGPQRGGQGGFGGPGGGGGGQRTGGGGR